MNESFVTADDIRKIPSPGYVELSRENYDKQTKGLINNYYEFMDHIRGQSALNASNPFAEIADL